MKRNIFKCFFLVPLVFFGLVNSTSAALTCTSDFTFDWDTQSWPAPVNPTTNIGDYSADLSETFTNIDGSGLDATITVSSDNTTGDLNRSFEFYVDNGNADQPAIAADVVGPGDTDGDGTNDAAFQVIVNPVDDAFTVRTDMDVFLDVTLSEPVSELELIIADIDHNDTAQDRQDQVTITGNGGTVIPTLTSFNATPNYTISGNTATALVNGLNASPTPVAGELDAADAVLVVTFDEPVTSFRIVYSDAIDSGTGADGTSNVGGLRGISMLGDFSFCRDTDLQVTKTDSLTNYTPGETFSYDIVVTNDAGGIPADGAVFADALPTWATNVNWTCAAAGGATCPNGTAGSGETFAGTIASFPAGSSLTFTINGTYSADMADYP